MPDEPVGGMGPREDPEEELRRKFEEIEKEASQISYPEVPIAPTDEDLRVRSYSSPIEGMLDPINPAHHSGPDPEEERLRQLDERLAAAAARQKEEASGIHSEFEEQLREFDGKFGPTLDARKSRQEEAARKQKSERSASKGLGLGLAIAYTILGLPLVGIGIGWLLDNRFQTNIWKGILATIGACLGVGFTVMLMNRANDQQ